MTSPTPSPYAREDVPGVLPALEDGGTVPRPDAGTPLSALAAAAPEEDGAAKLERLEAHLVLVDGREFRVRIVNRDFVAWDLTRGKRKWPMAEDAPFLLNTFLTFAALRREGSWTGSEFAAFEESVDYLQLSRGEAARPTRAGVGPA